MQMSASEFVDFSTQIMVFPNKYKHPKTAFFGAKHCDFFLVSGILLTI